MTVSYERTVDPATGLLSAHLNWSYEYNPLVEQAISENVVVITLERGQGLQPSSRVTLDFEVSLNNIHSLIKGLIILSYCSKVCLKQTGAYIAQIMGGAVLLIIKL